MSLAVLAFAAALAATDAPAPGLEHAAKALEEKNPREAILELEQLADQGVIDPSASFDRGLAYAMRAAISPQPGDFGRAIHGFEEAADLAGTSDLERVAKSTSRSLRQEVSKRNARAGVTVGVEPSPSVDRAIARALPENAWALGTVALSWLATIAMVIATTKKLSTRASQRTAAMVVTLTAASFATFTAMVTWFARRERLEYTEGIVIAELAHPEDDERKNIPAEYPLPEGTRLLILDESGSRVKVRLVARDAWVSRNAVLVLSKKR